MSEKTFMLFASWAVIMGMFFAWVGQRNENDRLRSENQCLIRTAHIGSAAFATIGKDGHAHTVYRWEDCKK